MRITLIFFFLFVAVSCTACPECGKDENSSDVVPDIDIDDGKTADIDIDNAKECPPYTGECAFSETMICKDDILFVCVQTLKDGCIERYHYQQVEVCSSGCKVDVEESATAPGEAHCIPLEENPCPDFSLIDFPLTDKFGLPTFCRDCDTPTEKDPLCMENLWKFSNEKLCTDKPSYDCCGYPCIMDMLEPRYQDDFSGETYPSQALDRCDILLNPKNPEGWSIVGNYYNEITFSYRLSQGKIGFYAGNNQILDKYYYADIRYFEYDIETQKYRVVAGNVKRGFGYYDGSFVGTVRNLKKNQPDGYMGYPFMIDKNGKRRILYWNKYYVRSTPIITDKWILMNVNSGSSGSGYDTLYGRVDQPTLHSFGRILYDVSIVNDTLVFTSKDHMTYVCNLASETSVLGSCEFFNRAGDNVESVQLDRDNPNLIYYSDELLPGKMVQVDVTTLPFSYKEFNIASSDQTFNHTQVLAVRSNLALIQQEWIEAEDEYNFRICYYRLDSERMLCPEPVLWGGVNVFDMSHGDFEAHTLIWSNDNNVKVRDMECYCDLNPELCPFDDYTPNIEHPKIKGFRDDRL